MRWPWARDHRHSGPLEEDVTRMSRQVRAQAAAVNQRAREVAAAAELVRLNARVLRRGAGDRRWHLDPAYAGPERRGHR